MDKVQLEQEKQEIATLIEKEVDQKVDEKIISMTKLSTNGSPVVDRETIKQQIQSEVFTSLKQLLESQFNECQAFYEQLKVDNLPLYDKLTKAIEEKVDVKSENIDLEKLLEKDFKPSAEDLTGIKDLGIQWFKKEDWTKALHYFTYLTLVNGNNTLAWVLKGMAEHNLGHHELAQRNYAVALALDPENILAHIQFMKCLIASNHDDLARSHFEIFKSKMPSTHYESDEYFVTELASIKDFLLSKAA